MADKDTKEPKFQSTRPPVMVPKDPKDATAGFVNVGQQPPDMTGYEGSYRMKELPKDAPKFGLKIVEEDHPDGQYGHTHHLRSTEHSWSGTEADFKEKFDKA